MDFEELHDIADYPNWLEITPIELGRSGESKYHIIRNNGIHLILRTSDISAYERHRESAVFAKYIYDTLGLHMNIPIEVAACNNDRLAYTIYTWVEGVDANDRIPNLHTPEQARCGEAAGRLLKRIHSIEAPPELSDWESYFGKRLTVAIERFLSYRISFRGDENVISFLKGNRSLLKNRPQTAVHGDFHTGNLIFVDNEKYGVIDFGRWCWGDPYMDFQCIRRSCTVPFSRGQITGYFGGSIPTDFFPLMAYYTAAALLVSICEAYPRGRHALDEAVRFAEKTAREYNQFEGLIPTWY